MSVSLYWFGSSFKFSFSVYVQFLSMKVNKSSSMAVGTPVYISMLTMLALSDSSSASVVLYSQIDIHSFEYNIKNVVSSCLHDLDMI